MTTPADDRQVLTLASRQHGAPALANRAALLRAYPLGGPPAPAMFGRDPVPGIDPPARARLLLPAAARAPLTAARLHR